MNFSVQDFDAPVNPLDIMEEVVFANDWLHNRSSDCELVFQIGGQWCNYNITVFWHRDMQALFFGCQMDIRIPDGKLHQICEVLILNNDRLWLGHFDYTQQNGTIAFRHTIPLRGTNGVSLEQIEDLIETAISESDRLFPALQQVMLGKDDPRDLLTSALMETVGEA